MVVLEVVMGEVKVDFLEEGATEAQEVTLTGNKKAPINISYFRRWWL